MKIIQLSFYIILFLFFSCKENAPTNRNNFPIKIKTKKLNISFALTNYDDIEFTNYGRRLFTSKIALSDSILLIVNVNEFDSIKNPKTQIWIKGKKMETTGNYSFLIKKFKLKEISITDFVIQKNDTLNNNLCFPNIDKNNSYFRKTKNNILLNFYKGWVKKDTTIFFNICNCSTKEKIPIYYEIEATSTCFFLQDITGDGIEEVFMGYYLVNGRNNNSSIIINNVFSISNK